jgi:hypothetical protein
MFVTAMDERTGYFSDSLIEQNWWNAECEKEELFKEEAFGVKP